MRENKRAGSSKASAQSDAILFDSLNTGHLLTKASVRGSMYCFPYLGGFQSLLRNAKLRYLGSLSLCAGLKPIAMSNLIHVSFNTEEKVWSVSIEINQK